MQGRRLHVRGSDSALGCVINMDNGHVPTSRRSHHGARRAASSRTRAGHEKLQPVRGMPDVFPAEQRRRRLVEAALASVAEAHGFGEVSTPVVEPSALFERSLGDATDVVTKEMYAFADRAGHAVTLRPEATAGVVRAVVNAGLAHTLPQRLWYSGPMFRYERPQRGRHRQFWQFGVELLGPAEALSDVEIIHMAHRALRSMPGVGASVTLQLNSLGDRASQAAYSQRLGAFLQQHAGSLSADSKARLARGAVLRVLDSKDPADMAIVAEAPPLLESLGRAAAERFAAVQHGLAQFGVPFEVNPRLVRGLDYYCHTAFEFVCTDDNAPNVGTVLAGGRYDGLVAELGGPDVAGVGWAAGVDRIALLLDNDDRHGACIAGGPRVVVVLRAAAAAAGGGDGAQRVHAVDTARDAHVVAAVLSACAEVDGIAVEVHHSLSRSWKKSLRAAAQRPACVAAVFIGDDEVARGRVTCKLLESGRQVSVAPHELAGVLSGLGNP